MDEWSIMPLNGLVENEIECVRFAHGADYLRGVVQILHVLKGFPSRGR